MHELKVHQVELEMQNQHLRTAQLALEESRDHYAALYEFAPLGYLTLSRAGQIVAINLTGCTLLGRERGKLLQHRFDLLVSPPDRDRWHIFVSGLLNQTEQRGIELALQRGDSATFFAHLDCLNTKADGHAQEFQIALTDISAMQLNKQLQQAQDELREQLIFQTSLLESVPVPIFFKDCQGRYQGCNHAYEEALGKSREQILGKSVFDMASREIAEKYHAMDAELLQHPGTQMYEWKIQKPSGEIREVVFHKASFLRNDGSVGGLIGAVVDITDLKRKDKALHQSEERIRLATETARDAIIMLEAENGTITAWNPAAEVIFGYAREEALGRVLHDLLTPLRFREMAQKGLAHFVTCGEGAVMNKTLELPALHKDGTEFFIELSLSSMQIDGKWFATGIARDITERKQTEVELSHALLQNQQQLEAMKINLEDTVKAISTIVEMRDPYTSGHQIRVAALAAAIATQMGLPDEQVHGIHLAGVVHDLGKIQIPAEILSKPGKLNAIEYSYIKSHAQAGYDILCGIKFPWPIAQMVLQHHERLDGSGYPQGLKGDAILLEARILAVSDVVEAISSHRPYRPALGMDAALAEIARGSGVQFDTAVVDACIKVVQDHGMKLPE